MFTISYINTSTSCISNQLIIKMFYFWFRRLLKSPTNSFFSSTLSNSDNHLTVYLISISGFLTNMVFISSISRGLPEKILCIIKSSIDANFTLLFFTLTITALLIATLSHSVWENIKSTLIPVLASSAGKTKVLLMNSFIFPL